ncbi:type II secretion system protein [Actinoplanes sp. KI2]|uniref:type IV pilus modification PilV family protein n=1 Tax=Actinoplanes sp. KI2 TaxID=2983315 RepID=UPI0021D5767F|nr:prepilin-type N-terminal cleavage/methylation domain-containing protein [Actinoplanes sp. KI2]MCU7724383.1 type II secretion system protein [Actinoplanes sp. KI2]
MRAAGGRSDSGETLIELVVAIAIMSTAVVAVLGCLVTGIMVSDIHRKQTTAGVTLRNFAEAISRTVDAGGYPAGCAALTPSFTPPAGYSASIAKVGYWTGSAWSSSCSTDKGLRQLDLQVASSDSRAVERLVIVVRKPCGLADALCG